MADSFSIGAVPSSASGTAHGKGTPCADDKDAVAIIRLLTSQASSSLSALNEALQIPDREAVRASSERLGAMLQQLSNQCLDLVRLSREHAAADVQLVQQRLEVIESEKKQLRWELMRDMARRDAVAQEAADALLGQVHDAQTSLRRLEAKGKADAAGAQRALEASEAKHASTRETLSAQLSSERAEATRTHAQLRESMSAKVEALAARLLGSEANGATALCAFVGEISVLESQIESDAAMHRQTVAALVLERDRAIAALATEIERLRGLIRQMTGPAPTPSDLQRVHLEAFKRSPNAAIVEAYLNLEQSRRRHHGVDGSPAMGSARSAPLLRPTSGQEHLDIRRGGSASAAGAGRAAALLRQRTPMRTPPQHRVEERLAGPTKSRASLPPHATRSR